MTDVNQDFELYVGTALEVQITVIGVNLTGFSAKWAMSRISSSGCCASAALLEKCSDNATLTITPGTDSLVTFTLDEADTVDLPATFYAHQLTIIDGFDNPTVVTEGTVELLAKIVNTC